MTSTSGPKESLAGTLNLLAGSPGVVFRKKKECSAIAVAALAIILNCLCGPVFAQGHPTDAVLRPRTDNDRATMEALVIGPGDLLDLTVYNVPDLILRVRVDMNGVVRLPLIGDVHLGGKTVRGAEQTISEALVKEQMVKDPEVSLLISEFATQGITVAGEVNTPGIYPLMGPHRLYDAISAAGGLTLKAGRTISIIHRADPAHPETIRLQSAASIADVNVMLQPGDAVVVSKAGVVYVVGEVNHPGAFLMEDNTSITILKAIALAQGTTKFASFKHASIIRRDASGMQQIAIPLNKIYHRKAPDRPLEPEDIIFIPTSNSKMYGAMGLQAALTASGTAAIYATR